MTTSSAPDWWTRSARSLPPPPGRATSRLRLRQHLRTEAEPRTAAARLTVSEHTRSSVGASAPFHLRVDPAGPPGHRPGGLLIVRFPRFSACPQRPLDAPAGLWL